MAERIKTALNNTDLKLWAKNSDDKWATMVFDLKTDGGRYNDNTLNITVWTGVVADADKKIEAHLDVVTLGIFLQAMQATIAAKVEPGQEFHAPVIAFEQTRWVKDNGKNKPDGTYVATKLHMGKDANGCCWIALTATKQGRPNIKFIFHVNKLAKLLIRQGSEMVPMTEAQTSVLAMRAYHQALSHFAYQLLASNYVQPEQQQQNGNNYQNRNQQSNQSSQSNYSGNGDDIPF